MALDGSKLIYGASVMPMEVLKELNERLPHVCFWNLYRQTKIAPLATAPYPEDALRKPGRVGKATLNVETRVVDTDMPGSIAAIWLWWTTKATSAWSTARKT